MASPHWFQGFAGAGWSPRDHGRRLDPELAGYIRSKLAEGLVESVERDQAAAAVISARLYEREPSEEWAQPQLVLEVSTSLDTPEAFAMRERLNEARRSLEHTLAVPAHTAVVVLHWRPDANSQR